MISLNRVQLYIKHEDNMCIRVNMNTKGGITTYWWDATGIQNRKAIIFRKVLNDLKAHGCCICGYNKYFGALDFHHVIDNMLFRIERNSMSRTNERIIEEFHKCMLLCSNCHREIHGVENGWLKE